MPEPVSRSLILRGFLRRNLLLVSTVAAGVALATAYFTTRIQPVYEASSALRIEEPQTPITDMLRPGARSPSRNAVATEIDMLRSRTMLGMVIDSLALQLSLRRPERVPRSALLTGVAVDREAPKSSYELTRDDTVFTVRHLETSTVVTRAAAGQPIELDGVRFELTPHAFDFEVVELRLALFEDTIDELRNSIRVARRSRESQFVDIRAESTDPALAAAIPNVLAERFIRERQDMQRSDSRSTATFLNDQIAKLSTQLAAAEDTLRIFRESEQVVSLIDQARTGVSQVADIQAQRDALEAERAALSNLIRLAGGSERGASAYRSLAAFPTLLRNQAVSNLLTSLLAVEDRRVELLSRRSVEDPDVQLLTQRARELEDELRSFSLAYLQGLSDQIGSLNVTMSRSQGQLSRLPAKEVRYARLRREVNGLEDIVLALQARLKEAEIAEAVDDASIQLVDRATEPRKPARPNAPLNVALALVAGLALGLTAAVGREYADRSVHTRHQIREATGMPVMGLVPSFTRADRQERARFLGPGARRRRSISARSTADPRRSLARGRLHPFAGIAGKSAPLQVVDAYQRLQTNLAFHPAAETLRVVQITSALPGEGKTTSAINLALIRARLDERVLLIDADLRRSQVHEALGITRQPGLVNVLRGGVPIADALHLVTFGERKSLYVLTAGSSCDYPEELILSESFAGLLEQLRADFSTVIIDSPPVNAVAETTYMSTLVDGVLLIARSGVTTHESLAFCMEQLRQVRAPLIGTVLNDIDFAREASYDESYRYYGYSNADG